MVDGRGSWVESREFRVEGCRLRVESRWLRVLGRE